MRVFLGCVVLLVLPTACIFGWKHYQATVLDQEQQQAAAKSNWNNRGEVLFFNASWCGPCRTMKPIVSQLRGKGYRLRDVDVDRNRKLADKYKIRGIPTFVFLENGREVHRFSGGTSAENLMKLCASPAYH